MNDERSPDKHRKISPKMSKLYTIVNNLTFNHVSILSGTNMKVAWATERIFSSSTQPYTNQQLCVSITEDIAGYNCSIYIFLFNIVAFASLLG